MSVEAASSRFRPTGTQATPSGLTASAEDNRIARRKVNCNLLTSREFGKIRRILLTVRDDWRRLALKSMSDADRAAAAAPGDFRHPYSQIRGRFDIMKKRASSGLIAAVALVAAFAPRASQADFIYDNTTTTFTGNRSFTALQSGDEVKAGGTDLAVTRLEIGLNSQGQAATLSTFQAFLYANDGAGGAPGTLLWQSALLQSVALTGGNDLIAFAVPDVLVPDTFTWAAQTGAATPVAAGLPIFGSPTVGTE